MRIVQYAFGGVFLVGFAGPFLRVFQWKFNKPLFSFSEAEPETDLDVDRSRPWEIKEKE